MASPFDELEQLIGRDVGRNISSLVTATQGQLEAAARSIASHPNAMLGIVTGFFVPTTTPPAAETDGPIGSAILAGVLERSGIAVELITDQRCRSALIAVRDALEIDAPVISVADAADVDELCARYTSRHVAISHLIAIERPGPAASGRVRNFKGRDLTDVTAPLHRLFEVAANERPYVTIGIGDGGNEIGMGNLDRSIVASNIENGADIACATPCDHLVVSGVSNWGAYALAAAIALLQPKLRHGVGSVMTTTNCDRLLKALVDNGPAVDAIIGVQQYSIDALPPEAHNEVLVAIEHWLDTAVTSASS